MTFSNRLYDYLHSIVRAHCACVSTASAQTQGRCFARSLRDFVAQRPAGDVMTAEERAALEEPTAAAKKLAVAAARVAAAEAAKAAAEEAARRRYGLSIVHVDISRPLFRICMSRNPVRDC